MMAGRIDRRLAELGIVLPEPSPPWANYLSHLTTGNLVFVAGQLPLLGDERYLGQLGRDLSVEQGYRAARLSAINLLPHLKNACGGDLDRVTRILEVGGFVNSAPDFHDHPGVVNGASDFLIEVFGETGRHTRFAVGVAALPFNYAVEIKALFEIT